MKKILIIGASILQLPAIKRAKELGYYVGVVDYDPKAIGIRFADEYFNVSTIDVDGIVEVARGFKPDGVMTLATDMPTRSVAAVCEFLDLHGITPDTALKATDKGEMIKAFERHGVEHPWYHIVSDKSELECLNDSLTYPCIMKPTDNAGSRGVVLCHNKYELKKEYDYSFHESRGGTVIVEEFLEGPEFSVEVMVMDGEPHVLQITDKLTTGAPHFVEMGHSQPTRQPEEIQNKIKDLACRATRAVGINVGPAHVEIILTKSGPKMVELGARMGGDCITTHLVPLSTGIDMIGATIHLACGEEVDINPKFYKGAAIRYFNAHNGIIKAIKGIDEAKKIHGIKEISIVRGVGDKIGEIGNSSDRLGFVIAQGEDEKNAIELCNKAINCISIVLE